MKERVRGVSRGKDSRRIDGTLAVRGSRRTPRRRSPVGAIGVVVAAAGALLAAAGCGPGLAGAAAVLGDYRITDQVLAEQVSQVTSALEIQTGQDVSAVILNRLVTQRLIADLAAKNGVSVTEGEVDAFISQQSEAAGGTEAFEQALMRRGIPPDDIPSAARATLLVAKLGSALAPDQEPKQQELATVVAASQLSRELDTRVSPRFGQWNSDELRVGPPSDNLSIPAVAPKLSSLSPAPGS